jgi:predicted O-methyltransferase YrrM
MAASVPRAPSHPQPAARALRGALWTTALGRIPPEERAWAARIEARRAEIAPPETSGFVHGMSISPVWGRFLMRMVRRFTPRSCVELGTAFGISAAYQAAALELNGAGTLTTLERDQALAGVAEEGLARLRLPRASVRLGPINASLDSLVGEADPIDYAFLDADHTEQATLSHFAALLPHLREGAVVVLDDVNWSDEMRRAWGAIRTEPRVSASLGLRRMGIAIIVAHGDGLPHGRQ